MSDFNILIGVDMSDAESQIKESIKKIGENYKLKLEAVIDNKDAIIKDADSIKKVFKSISNIDVDFGLEDQEKLLKIITKLLQGVGDSDLSNAGKEFAQNMKEAKNEVDEVRQAYDQLMRVTEKVDKKGRKSKEVKTGSKFDNVTKVEGTQQYKADRNIEGLDSYVDKAMNKIDEYKLVTQKYENEVSELAISLTKLHDMLESGDAGFNKELKRIQTQIEYYDKLEKQLKEVEDVKAKQAQEAIKWANKLAEVERQGALVNPASSKKLTRLVGEMSKGEFKDLDSFQKKLAEVGNQYKLIEGQIGANKFGRKKSDEVENLKQKVSKNIDPSIVGQKDYDAVVNEISKIQSKDVNSNTRLEQAVKNVNKLYDQILQKQKDIIQGRKEEAELQEHLLKTENAIAEREQEKKAKAYEIQQRTGLVDNKASEVASKKADMTRFGFVNPSEFDAVEEKLRHLGKIARSEYAENVDVSKVLKEVDKMMSDIASKHDMVRDRTHKLNASTHDWQKELDKIRSEGFLDASEFDTVEKRINDLIVDSDKFE